MERFLRRHLLIFSFPSDLFTDDILDGLDDGVDDGTDDD
jgi:hypothetical protein